MVNTEIPKHYTASPSSYGGTPHLTINREATLDLDSTNAFEGPEKLLEVWFSPSPAALPECAARTGLMVVPSDAWKDMLDLVSCKVLSIVNSEHVDAYLLSESSIGLPRILELAATYARFPHTIANLVGGVGTAAIPYRVFYSRKNFLFPDRQRGPHRSWRDEVRSLDRLFYGGSAYMIGKMNGEHWYLYLTEPNTVLTPPATPERTETEIKILDLPIPQNGVGCHGDPDDEQDETLEVLMTDLDETNARQFYLDNASAVAEGRYYQHTSRPKTLHKQLSTINESKFENMGLNRDCHFSEPEYFHEDDVDIFDNASPDIISLEYKDAFPTELTTEGHALGTVVSETSGLVDVYPTTKYPDARIDAYLFTPCGFSANGVIPSSGATKATHYFTVHVTPEPHCSYASFETNVPSRQNGRETAEVIEQVVSIFKPGRFSVTLFEAKLALPVLSGEADALAELHELERQAAKKRARVDCIKGYRRVDRIVHELEGYELVFRYYERWDWEGGAPRLGETGF